LELEWQIDQGQVLYDWLDETNNDGIVGSLMSFHASVNFGGLLLITSDRQCFRKIKGEMITEHAAGRRSRQQHIVDNIVQGHEACDASHQSQSRGDSTRHGERDPVAACSVLCRHGNFDIVFEDMTCQIVSEPSQGMVANGLMYRPLDFESSKAFGQIQLLLGNGIRRPALE
jgi:hypothetical protein